MNKVINKKYIKSKFYILLSMRKWPIKYIDWRLTTAYPKGWKFALLHPIILIKDLWKYLEWCQMIDKDIK